MNRQSGYSAIEMLTTLAVIGIVAGVITINLEPAEAPLQTGSRLVEGLLLQARSSAIATTSAYRVVPEGDRHLVIEYAGDCGDATWTNEPGAGIELPEEVSMSSTTWSVCFSRRGISTDNVTIALDHPTLGSSQVEVCLGGATRVTS